MSFLSNIGQSLFGKQPFQLIELTNTGSPKISGGTLLADAVLSENYNKSANVTTYPTEDGNDIAEHASVSGFSVTVSGITSDASMSYFDTLESIASSSLGQLFGAASKSQGVWTQLNEWMDNGQPLQLKAKYAKDGFIDKKNKIIPFVIESLSVPRDAAGGSAIRYNLSLRAIQLVSIGVSFTATTALADKGAQLLSSNQKSDAVDGQPTTGRTEEKLANNRGAQNRLGFN